MQGRGARVLRLVAAVAAFLPATGGGVTRVPVQFRYGTEAAWQDVVVLVREGSGYAIDDIEFSGAGPFNPPGRLSDVLDRVGE